jgi:hypothetical protein
MTGTNALVLAGVVVYLIASMVLWRLLMKEPPRIGRRPSRPPRWPVRLAKAIATLIGGAAAGAASVLVVATIVNAGRPGTLTGEAMGATWAVGGVTAMLFIGRAPLIRRTVTRTCLAVGVQGVLMPLATLVSFAVAGSRLPGAAGTGSERAVEVLGLRLVGSLPAVWIGLGAFGIGLALVIAGDRAGRTGRPTRRRFRSSRAGVISARARR